MKLSNLQLRFASAAIGLPIVIVLIIIGGWPFAIVAGIIAVLAAAEFTHGFLLPSQPLSAVWGLGPGFIAPGIMVAGAYASPLFILVGVLIGVTFLAAGLSRSNFLGPRKPFRIYASVIFYIGLLLSTMVLLRNEDNGRDWVLLALFATFAADTGAYTVGKLIGRHKMAPTISPGKTWEGAMGGYATGALAVLALHALFGLPGALAAMVPLALLLPIAAIVGDLLESWLKRRMGVKDSSGFVPGHGGFLDRLDSVLFVVPAVYLYIVLVID